MEWWKLFSGTFILIFLAELGDKTQLAAMAKTADSPGGSAAKWVVFVGASLALVASTFIAVFAGHLLRRIIPDERYLQLAAALLFLAFGALMLGETWMAFSGAKRAAAAAAARPGASGGLAGSWALRGAMDLEAFVVERYRQLAAAASPELGGTLMDLAREEEAHLSALGRLVKGQAETPPPARDAMNLPKAPAEADILALVEHEEATAAFYHGLATKTVLPGAAAVLFRLADEERGHADRLRAFAGSVRLKRRAGDGSISTEPALTAREKRKS